MFAASTLMRHSSPEFSLLFSLGSGLRLLLRAIILTLVLVSTLQAGTIVRVSTSVGDFSIELDAEAAPLTVENFLNYVNRNAYNGTFLHRVVDDFVVQGGAYRFERFVGLIEVPTDPPVVNEFSLSNTRGTVAMAKLSGDPNSATVQWFVNLNDNVNLDTTNGGFTVFGRVLGDGMEILDAIDALPSVSPGLLVPSAPYFTPSYTGPWDFVYINAEVTERFSSAPHVFEPGSGLLITAVNIDDGTDHVALNFNAVPGSDPLVIEANMESVIVRQAFDGMASYSSSDQRLRIPQLEVAQNGGAFVVRDVVFVRSGETRFTLESFTP